MPFTGAHPAAIIPLAKHRFILSALIIGSIAPDLGYYVGFATPNRISHSILGIFLFSLPSGFLFFLIFHYILKRPLLELFPDSLRSRLFKYTKKSGYLSFKQLKLVILSIIIGAFTHIAWDTLTHEHEWKQHGMNFVEYRVLRTSKGSIALHHIFQHGSTVAGLTIIAIWFTGWYRKTRPQIVPGAVFSQPLRYIFLLAMIGISLLLAYPPQLNREIILTLSKTRSLTEYVVVKSISIMFIQLFVFSAGLKMFLILKNKIIPESII